MEVADEPGGAAEAVAGVEQAEVAGPGDGAGDEGEDCAAVPSVSAEGGPAPYWDSCTYNTIGDLTGITFNNPGGLFTATGTYPAADPTGATLPGGDTYCGPHKQYTGAHGCVGQTQAAMNACVQAYDAAVTNSNPRGADQAPIVVNRPNPLLLEISSMEDQLIFKEVLQVFNTSSCFQRQLEA